MKLVGSTCGVVVRKALMKKTGKMNPRIHVEEKTRMKIRSKKKHTQHGDNKYNK